MRDYIELGAVPAEEEGESVGPDCDYRKMRNECIRFRQLIRQVVGSEVGQAKLAIKRFQSGFGPYYEVVCWYDTEDEDGMDYAFKVESNLPTWWKDKSTLEELDEIY